ncbi:Ferredoxin C 2, chloroplastic [Datura stramonium]|uniref:Ferredoxin n=1 Tax=Datura stramonium TaxID=4076 RepID=A0ABS8W1N7_DATST|nr:Ferredoxin C 2, chloroplastic [Datura stramonium]
MTILFYAKKALALPFTGNLLLSGDYLLPIPSTSLCIPSNAAGKLHRWFKLPVAVVSGQRAVAISPSVPTHKVTVVDRQRGVVHEFLVPEDQYILHTAEAQNITLPFACRHGCCTSCAVRVKSGQLRQPEALGISAELKSKGYALLCVGFPSSDLEVETQDEDEERDDYALELALGDE